MLFHPTLLFSMLLHSATVYVDGLLVKNCSCLIAILCALLYVSFRQVTNETGYHSYIQAVVFQTISASLDSLRLIESH